VLQAGGTGTHESLPDSVGDDSRLAWLEQVFK
jgi:hypothetical protein